MVSSLALDLAGVKRALPVDYFALIHGDISRVTEAFQDASASVRVGFRVAAAFHQGTVLNGNGSEDLAAAAEARIPEDGCAVHVASVVADGDRFGGVGGFDTYGAITEAIAAANGDAP